MAPKPIVRTPMMPIPPRGEQGLVDHASAMHRTLFNSIVEQNTKINELIQYAAGIETILQAFFNELTVVINADGTSYRIPGLDVQIAMVFVNETVAIANGAGVERIWTYPQAFASAPYVVATGGVGTGGTTGLAARVSAGLPAAPTTTSARIHYFNDTGGAIAGFNRSVFAIGPYATP